MTTTMADVRAEAGGAPGELAAALRELAPLLRKEGERAEELRRLTDEAVSALKAAGFFRVWVPRVFGGMEMDLVPALEIFEALSRVEGAAGWTVGNAAAIHTLCQVLPDETAEEIFATQMRSWPAAGSRRGQRCRWREGIEFRCKGGSAVAVITRRS